MIRFLSIEDVLRLHAIAIEDQGGDPTLRDRGALESAIAQARQQFGGAYAHETIPEMAGAYAFHICKNHPFVDGNKRASLAAMLMFLSDNGWSLTASQEEAVDAILEVAGGTLSKAEISDWISSHATPTGS